MFSFSDRLQRLKLANHGRCNRSWVRCIMTYQGIAWERRHVHIELFFSVNGTKSNDLQPILLMIVVVNFDALAQASDIHIISYHIISYHIILYHISYHIIIIIIIDHHHHYHHQQHHHHHHHIFIFIKIILYHIIIIIIITIIMTSSMTLSWSQNIRFLLRLGERECAGIGVVSYCLLSVDHQSSTLLSLSEGSHRSPLKSPTKYQ